MSLARLPENPATLAAASAERIATDNPAFAITPAENRVLTELDTTADAMGFIGRRYFVEAGRSLSIPTSWSHGEPVNYVDFMGLSFEGRFACYSKVVVGRLIGAHVVRALCLSFHDALLMPFFDQLAQGHLLHVPVMAVSSISAQENR